MNKPMQPNINEFMDKVKAMEKGEKLDLSSDEDLSIAIMTQHPRVQRFLY